MCQSGPVGIEDTGLCMGWAEHYSGLLVDFQQATICHHMEHLFDLNDKILGSDAWLFISLAGSTKSTFSPRLYKECVQSTIEALN